ncbi:hypothetical protein [Zongyangia hominis]|uniref:Uncharacterized protein n=1 Tax=Zongyangia hominis TaxID=2763677 RepID=A0A926I7F6_9FIRM|nr:hypothetical protein [Zongyangia hominis]MBC8571049.1 hypothetical protein [Zongyangia hominis]
MKKYIKRTVNLKEKSRIKGSEKRKWPECLILSLSCYASILLFCVLSPTMIPFYMAGPWIIGTILMYIASFILAIKMREEEKATKKLRDIALILNILLAFLFLLILLLVLLSFSIEPDF